MITPLQLVSISDFILAIECIFFSGLILGKIKYPSQKSLGLFLFFAGISAFMGGLDHGFFETIHQRYYPRTFTYLFVACATFYIFSYTISTYSKGKLRFILHILSYTQLVAFIISSFYYHNFLLVICNYAPVLLFFFIMNLINIKNGKSEGYFSLFCFILIVATIIQVNEISLSNTINSDTLFHIVAFFGYIFMYYGIRKLKN